MPKRSGSGVPFQEDAPWRAVPAAKPIPKVHQSPILQIAQNPYSDYALFAMKHPDPIGSGLGIQAIVEAAGPECLVPGLTKPIQLLGLQLWPVEMDFRFLEPVGRQLNSIGKFMDSAVNLMNKSFIDDR